MATAYGEIETGGADSTALLGTSGNRPTPPLADRQGKRASRHQLKRAQRAFTTSRSSRFCWYAMGGHAVVDVGRQLTAHVSGIQRCGSPWACPVCAPVVRERRAQEIDRGASAALGRGWTVLFVTLTVRHHQGDALDGRLATVSEALNLTLKGSGWDRRRTRLGYKGAIRAVEVTHGRNGWHPHTHALLFFDRQLDDQERADLEQWLYGRWAAVCERRGFGTPTRAHGIDVRPVATTDDLGSYLTKVEGGWGAGLELARADLKRAKGKGSTPMALLTEFATTGDTRSLGLWQEYEQATAGRRAIVWSPGLRGELLDDDQEQADVELAASEGADLTLLRALVKRANWQSALAAGTVGELLTSIEHFAALTIATFDALGLPLVPIDRPPDLDREAPTPSERRTSVRFGHQKAS